jgi:hypothetical protein
MSNGLGITFGEKHTFRDWGLLWLEPYTIDYPEPEVYVYDIPGADKPLDLTEALTGRVRYKQRSFNFSFEVLDQDYFDHEWRKQVLSTALHGKKTEMRLDTDPGYFYVARPVVAFEKTMRSGSVVTISGTADPYKYEELTSMDDWVWDTFNFETGNVRQANNLEVVGELSWTVPPSQLAAMPRFECSAPMEMDFRGDTYQLPAGEWQSPYVVFGDVEEVIVFRGNGIVNIDYRGGVL